MSLTFDSFLSVDWTKYWDNPIDLRYLFDGVARYPGLCWIMRSDMQHALPQLSGVPAFDWTERTCIEIRLFETPDLDAITWFLIVSEINKRNQIDARWEDIHENWYGDLIMEMPPINVPYIGRA